MTARTAGSWTAGSSRHLLALLFASSPLFAQDPLPEVRVDRDDFEITTSCRVVAPAVALHDANGDGLVHVKASGITVEFAAPILGLFAGAGPPDTLTGIAIRVDGQRDVTLRGPHIRGFRVGIHASRADGLRIEGADLADMFRHRLKSTPAAEDAADWLWPHENDQNEWLRNYGAAIYVEDSSRVVIAGCRGRRGQNGIVIDRVDDSQVYDNDFSFLSGWGLAMWRSRTNLVNRNAFDFCIRGYSHGVYNRGQDSAGILMFEQCSANVIAENSVTHGGDGIFGFAGKEALGENPPPDPGFDHSRRGCNDNAFVANDLSYAAAHGLEMTFSFGNSIAKNRIVGNAICGIWGGYSRDTTIWLNDFADNGEAGYGLERGGVNIEHGGQNLIRNNTFLRDRCGVHLWCSANEAFSKKPWGRANFRGCRENRVVQNAFELTPIAIHLRGPSETIVAGNRFRDVEREIDAEPSSSVVEEDLTAMRAGPPDLPRWHQLGKTKPVGARAHLRGRENIVMTEWGPWDHESPLVRLLEAKGAEHAYALHAFEKPALRSPAPASIAVTIDASADPPRLTISAKAPGVVPYALEVADNPKAAPPATFRVTGTIVSTKWKVRFFPTSGKPHEDPGAWAKDSAAPGALTLELDSLDLPFGSGGPPQALQRYGFSDLRGKLPSNHFGLVAEAMIPLRKGAWRITTLSDDGVRVTAGGTTLIDNWTWHVPTKDTAVLELSEDLAVPIRVEYFELDGHAVLKLDLEEAK